MKGKKTIVAGIACGIVCAICVFLYTSSVQAEALAGREEILSRYGGEQIEACVATKDISAGETIGTSNVSQTTWVAHLLPDSAVLSLDEVIGKKTTSPIVKGEVVTTKRFATEDNAIAAPEGTSALSVPAKDVQAIGGAIEAGMKVDVYATGPTSTDVIAREVLVLATSIGEVGGSSSGIAWLTLALRDESIQEVITASQKTELYFVLPGNSSDTSTNKKDED